MEEELDSDNDENQLPDGCFAIKLSEETQERLEVVANWHLNELEPQIEIPLELLQKDLLEYEDQSDFHFLAELIKKCKLLAPLLIFDPTEQCGEQYLICLSGEAKYGYLQTEEEGNMALVDADSYYEYHPPSPKHWTNLKSDEIIERDMVTDSRPKIRLQIKRSVARSSNNVQFVDRDVRDVPDGYVACESYKDTHDWEHVANMERAMQAVPVLVDGSSQTELKHPKNVYTQYEPRVFTNEEVAKIWESNEMQKFLSKAEGVMKEVAGEPDIMGELRVDIECFYRRDHVEIVEETELVEHTFFTDLNFSHNCRVTHVRWHPTIEGIVAISVVENTIYEEYLSNLTKRMVMPTMVMIWSMYHPLFPQVLLRVPDDINVFEWHPHLPDTLVGGCMNGQIVIWDLWEYMEKFKRKKCVWNHSVVMSKQANKLHVDDGFIPILYWSAESNVQVSHQSPVEDMKWLPKNVWFSQESAYPKMNKHEENRQFITCSGDMYVLIWDLLKPEQDTDAPAQAAPAMAEEEDAGPKFKPRLSTWARLRAKSSVTPIKSGEKWSPATGKYSFLNKTWRPVHKIQFLDPTPQHNPNPGMQRQELEVPFLKILITALSVTDRPDLIDYRRKTSTKGGSKSGGGGGTDPSGSVGSKSGGQRAGSQGSTQDSDAEEDKHSSGRGSRSSVDMGKTKDGDDDDDLPPADPSNLALPTMLMAGTILGAVFRADLSKNRVDVETNNLLCFIEWLTPVHDGPVTKMTKSPFLEHLLLTMGGYSFAIWNEGIMNRPVLIHFVEREQFTCVAWSIEQPNIVYFSTESGTLEVWDITKRKSEPIQTQNIAGRAINVICPYRQESEIRRNKNQSNDGHYISIADNSGTLRVMTLPKHLWQVTDQAVDDMQCCVDSEISKKVEKERFKHDRERSKKSRSKTTIDDEIEEDTKVTDTDDDFLLNYFRREKVVMHNMFGPSWREFIKHPDLNRADYVGAWQEKKEDEGQSTLTTSRKLSIMRAIKSKSTTISPFLAASRSGSSLSGGSSRSSLRSPSPH